MKKVKQFEVYNIGFNKDDHLIFDIKNSREEYSYKCQEVGQGKLPSDVVQVMPGEDPPEHFRWVPVLNSTGEDDGVNRYLIVEVENDTVEKLSILDIPVIEPRFVKPVDRKYDCHIIVYDVSFSQTRSVARSDKVRAIKVQDGGGGS